MKWAEVIVLALAWPDWTIILAEDERCVESRNHQMKYQMIPLPHFDLDWTLTFFRGYNTVVPNPLNRNNLCQFDVKIQTEKSEAKRS